MRFLQTKFSTNYDIIEYLFQEYLINMDFNSIFIHLSLTI
jgi:hypothetical protein